MVAQRGRQYVFDKEKTVAVEELDPLFDLLWVGRRVGEILLGSHAQCSCGRLGPTAN